MQEVAWRWCPQDLVEGDFLVGDQGELPALEHLAGQVVCDGADLGV